MKPIIEEQIKTFRFSSLDNQNRVFMAFTKCRTIDMMFEHRHMFRSAFSKEPIKNFFVKVKNFALN